MFRSSGHVRLADSVVDAIDHHAVVFRGLLVGLVRILARFGVTSTAAFMASSWPVVRTVRGEIAHAFTNTVGVCLAVSRRRCPTCRNTLVFV
jgi:hypothetical protein